LRKPTKGTSRSVLKNIVVILAFCILADGIFALGVLKSKRDQHLTHILYLLRIRGYRRIDKIYCANWWFDI